MSSFISQLILLEIFTIPRGEKKEKVAIPLHPLEFFIQHYGNINGLFDPSNPSQVSLYDSDGMANLDAVSLLRPARGRSKTALPPDGVSFISLIERWGSENDGVVIAPSGLSDKAVRVITNHVYQKATDLNDITDEMQFDFNTGRFNLNVRVIGVSKLVAVRGEGKLFNYSIFQPDSQTVEGYMQRSTELMQYLIDNRDTFQDDMEYWGVKGDQLKK